MTSKTISVLTIMAFQFLFIGSGQEIKPSLVTCDFDLVDVDEKILDSLPTECREAANDADLRESMRLESLKFNEFMTELQNREKAEGQGDDEEEIPPKNWDRRSKIYADAELNLCLESENSREFIECLINKRDLMIDAVRNEGI